MTKITVIYKFYQKFEPPTQPDLGLSQIKRFPNSNADMVIVIKDILTELSPVHSPPPLHQASVFCWNPVAYYK